MEGVLRHHWWVSDNHPPSIFVESCTLWLSKRQVCPFLDAIFPPFLLSASLSSSWHCTLQHHFCQAWWSYHMSIQCYFSFLHIAKQAVMWHKGWIYSFSKLLINSNRNYFKGNGRNYVSMAEIFLQWLHLTTFVPHLIYKILPMNKYNRNISFKKYVFCFGLVILFNGISTFMGYLMPKPSF